MTEATEIQIPRLCDQCSLNATRASVVLCGTCAQSFRVIYLPDDVRPWEEISRDAHGDNGAAMEELIKGLQIRIFNQQRELSKLNRRVCDEIGKLDSVMKRLASSMEQSQTDDELHGPVIGADIVDSATRHIRRYLWLRRDNGYAPEEAIVRGGDQLDRLCDEGIREAHGVTA